MVFVFFTSVQLCQSSFFHADRRHDEILIGHWEIHEIGLHGEVTDGDTHFPADPASLCAVDTHWDSQASVLRGGSEWHS